MKKKKRRWYIKNLLYVIKEILYIKEYFLVINMFKKMKFEFQNLISKNWWIKSCIQKYK